MCSEAQGSEAHADAEPEELGKEASARKKGGKKLSNQGRPQGRTPFQPSAALAIHSIANEETDRLVESLVILRNPAQITEKAK
jgi:hypothetical protein